MCDKELLLGYLYDELPASDRQAFDRHLAACADCRDEVSGLRGTRTHLTSWAPPEPDLGFGSCAAPGRRRHGVAHVAGLGSGGGGRPHARGGRGIANIDIRVGGDGVVVQTGWNRTAAGAPAQTQSKRQR